MPLQTNPRNPWSHLKRALALGRAGDFSGALEIVSGLRYHPDLAPDDAARVASQLRRQQDLQGGISKIHQPMELMANREGHWLPPFRVMDTGQDAPKPYPPTLALPGLTGQNNDYWPYHQAAAGLAVGVEMRLLLAYAVEDLQSCSGFLESVARQQPGVSVQLRLFAPGQTGQVKAALAHWGLEGEICDQPLLSAEAQALLQQSAAQVDLVALLSGAVVLDPGALVRAAHLGRVSDLMVQPLVTMSPEVSCNTPYAVKSAPGVFRSRFPFRELTGLNMVVPSALWRRVGGCDPEFEAPHMAARALGFQCFNLGAYFSPLLVPATPGDAPKASSRDQERFRQRCPNNWDRPADGLYEVPKVSIYIPAYNASKYIEQAVDSVLGQDFMDLEVCIGNDGSTDGTCDLLERSFGDEPRVRWVNLRNGGIGHASNQAILASRGLYVGQLDSDDRLTPGAVRRLVDVLDQNPDLACAYGSCERVDAQGRYLQDEYSWLHFSRQKMMITSIAHHFRMFRRANWERTSRFRTDIRNAVDYDIFLKLAETGRFQHIDEILYQRRWHGDNTSNVNEGFQTANTYRVQREALARQGLSRYWDVHVGDPSLPRRVGYKRKVTTPRVMFWPNYSRANPYQKLLYKQVMETHEVIAAPIEEAVRAVELVSEITPPIFHLHWTNFLFAGAKSRVQARLRIRTFLKQLNRFKDLGGRVVWTIHNTLSHDTPYVELEKSLSKRLVEMADVVHFHAAASVPEVQAVFPIPDHKIRIAPHGHYLGVYADYITRETARATLGIAEDEDVILFLGQVRPYKGVGQLIQSFRTLLADFPKARLVIAGAVHDDFWSTVSPALTEAEQARVLTTDRFLDETEMQVFFRAADIAAFPYRNILTSGSLLLSLSFGVPAVVPRLGMTAEVLEGSDGGILYDPTEDGALKTALRKGLHAKQAGHLPQMQEAALKAGQQMEWVNLSAVLFDHI